MFFEGYLYVHEIIKELVKWVTWEFFIDSLDNWGFLFSKKGSLRVIYGFHGYARVLILQRWFWDFFFLWDKKVSSWAHWIIKGSYLLKMVLWRFIKIPSFQKQFFVCCLRVHWAHSAYCIPERIFRVYWTILISLLPKHLFIFNGPLVI